MAVVHGTNIDFQVPSLDLRFADRKDFIDTISGEDLITFTRNSVGTYVDANGAIQTATANTPRFDHDPATGESLGLLVEESRTNRFDNSLFAGSWGTFNGATRTFNAGTAPDGTNTAVLLTCNTSYENHVNYIISGSNNTVSVFAKKGTKNTLDIVDNSSNFYCRVNMTNWTVTQSTNCSVSLIPYPNQWYRILVSNITNVANYVKIGTYSTSEAGTVYLWGVQMEAATFASSYIPTSGSTVTRSADVAQITGSNFSSWYNQSEGTLQTDVKPLVTGNYSVWTVSNGTSDERMLSYTGNSFSLYVVDGGTIQAQINSGTGYAVNTRCKAISAYKQNDFAYVNPAGTLSTDTSGTLPTVDRLQLMAGYIGGQIQSGAISRLTYYPTRLSNSLLQKLTK